MRESEPDVREAALAAVRAMLDTWCTDEITERLPAMTRLRFHLARRGLLEGLRTVIDFDRSGHRGKVVVDKGRAFGAYPFFRDPAVGAPDDCYDLTDQLPVRHHLDALSLSGTRLELKGHAYIHRVDTREAGTEIVLRERESRTEYAFPARTTATAGLTRSQGEGLYDYGQAGFSVRIDTATAADGDPLPSGLWDVFLRVRSQDIVKEARLGNRRAPDIDSRPRPHLVRLTEARAEWQLPLLIQRAEGWSGGELHTVETRRSPVIGMHFSGGGFGVAVRETLLVSLQPHPGNARLILDNEKITTPGDQPLRITLTDQP